MSGIVLLFVGAVVFALAYVVYGRYLQRLFGVDIDRKTPAHTRTDGVDYLPTRAPVLFGHHFASIAGAGPIVGPIAAVYFGWGPVVLWILVGCVFIGAMHDFAALFVSIRDKGRSIGHVIEEHLGYAGRQLFLLFSWAALLLVVAVFGVLVAGAFVESPSVATASLLFVLMAPLFGIAVHKRGVSVLRASCVFVPLIFAAIWVGMKLPLSLESMLGLENGEQAKLVWLGILAVYAFVASVLPVWIVLQPRDYLNSFLLYAMILLGVLGIVVAGPVLQAPAFKGWVVMKEGAPSHLFPILFVTVACGACSGFHALVASGTTSKQITTEKHILPVGYGSMLVEGLLAIMAVISVAYLAGGDMEETIRMKKPVVAFAVGLAHFSARLGIPQDAGEGLFMLAISAFLLTTLDTATRLGRFAWQELFLPRHGDDKEVAGLHGAVSNRFVATLLVLVGAGFLVMMKSTAPDGTPIPGWKTIWPVFGASNQLLAALTLLVVTVILQKKKKNFLVTLVPMIFMMVVCLWALCGLFMNNARGVKVNWALMVATIFLVVMAVVLIVQAGSTFMSSARKEKQG